MSKPKSHEPDNITNIKDYWHLVVHIILFQYISYRIVDLEAQDRGSGCGSVRPPVVSSDPPVSRSQPPPQSAADCRTEHTSRSAGV